MLTMRLLVLAATLSLSAVQLIGGVSLARELLDENPEVASEAAVVTFGHSAAFFGIVGAESQRASMQAVLSSVGLDRSWVRNSVPSVVGHTMIEMFMGGAGAPNDLAEARDDLKEH